MRNPFRRAPAAPEPQMVPTGSKFPELCNLVSDFTGLTGVDEWLAFEKVDGIRGLLIDGKLLSREGARLTCADHAWPALCDLEARARQPLFVDFEYRASEGGFDATESEHKRGIGYGVCHIHDAFPFSRWLEGGTIEPAGERYESLSWWMRGIDSPFLRLIPASAPITDTGQVARLAHAMWSADEEGLVLKRASSPYQRRRTTDWVKVKKKIVQPLQVLDFLFHGDRFVGLLCKGPTGPLKITAGFKAMDVKAIRILLDSGRDVSDARAMIGWSEKAGSNIPRHAHFVSVAP